MNILMLSHDASLLTDSEAARRIASYGALFEGLTVIVFATGARKSVRLSETVTVLAPGGIGKIGAFFSALREILEEAKKRKYDLISSQDPFFIGFAGLIAASLRRLPFQVQLHTDCFSAAFRKESLRRRMEIVLLGIVLSRASCVRAVSERVAHGALKITRAPVAVLPVLLPAPSPGPFPAPFEKRRFTFLSVSRLTNEKRVGVLLDALRSVRDADLVVVGDGPLREALEACARAFGISDRVRFAGHANPFPYYAHADAYVQVSLYEGYGLTLMEAARAGLAIISTDVGIVGEVLHNEREVLVTEGSAASVARAMRRVMDEADFRARLGRGAAVAASRHILSPDEYLTRYREAMRACLS